MDNNDKTLFWGVSHIDGITPTLVQFDQATKSMLLDYTTSIQFVASQEAYTNNNSYPLVRAVSSVDGKTSLPIVVNATTGAVLAVHT